MKKLALNIALLTILLGITSTCLPNDFNPAFVPAEIWALVVGGILFVFPAIRIITGRWQNMPEFWATLTIVAIAVLVGMRIGDGELYSFTNKEYTAWMVAALFCATVCIVSARAETRAEKAQNPINLLPPD